MRILFTGVLIMMTTITFANALKITANFDDKVTPPRLELKDGENILIDTQGRQLYTDTGCQLKITADKLINGVTLVYTITNPGTTAMALPQLQVPGIKLPIIGTSEIDNWKVIKWRNPFEKENVRIMLHPLRSYPWQCYSPILGLRTKELVVGASLIYDPFETKAEIHTNYAFDRKNRAWTFIFRPVDKIVGQDRKSRKWTPAMLEPKKQTVFKIDLRIVKPENWLNAFQGYRDHFRRTFGERRHKRSNQPIFAFSLSSGPFKKVWSPENPRGFNPLPIQTDGWKGFPETVKKLALDKGFSRMMIWGAVGRQKNHPETNMAWEIGTGWVPAQKETIGEFNKLKEMGMDVGLWWGRCFSISGGFDSGERHAWNPDKETDNQAAFKELDLCKQRGVKLIGCDAVSSALKTKAEGWTPTAIVSFQRIYPMLHKRYPDLRWIVEPAANDFLHLWGSSFVWDKEINGPFEFADYLTPGHETNATMKRRYMADEKCDWQKRFEQLIKWGYTPIVFGDGQGQQVNVPENIQ